MYSCVSDSNKMYHY